MKPPSSIAGQQVGAEAAVGEEGADDQQKADEAEPERDGAATSSRTRLWPVEHAAEECAGLVVLEFGGVLCVGVVAVGLGRFEEQRARGAGVKVRASSSEVSSATVMVMASARKKLPVTPVTAMSGRKTTTGVMVEPMSGTRDLVQRLAHGVDARLRRRRDGATMFSTTTMASSMTRPMAAARPPSVIRLKLWPMIQRKRTVTATVTGMTRPAISEERQSRRKRKRMMQASTRPMRMASRTLRDALAHELRLVVEGLEV